MDEAYQPGLPATALMDPEGLTVWRAHVKDALTGSKIITGAPVTIHDSPAIVLVT
jgi:hypothetical protein